MKDEKELVEETSTMVQEELFKKEVEEPGITLGALQVVMPSLNKIFNANLPAKIAYKISKALNMLNKELKEIEELRIGLVKKYGKENGEGTFQVIPENMQAFATEFQDLLNIPVEGLVPVPIDFDILENAKVELSPIEINNLIKLGFLLEPK